MIRVTVDAEGLIEDKAKIREFVRLFIQMLVNAVYVATPVVTGYLRGSWFGDVGQEPEGFGAVGRDAIAEMSATAAELELGETYYAVNTAAYAARVELGFFGQDKLGRTYNQPGRHWVQATADRSQEIAEEAVRQVEER